MKKKPLIILLCLLILGGGSYIGVRIKRLEDAKKYTSTKLLNKNVRIGQFNFKILKVCKAYNKYKIFYKQNFLSKNYQLNFYFRDNLDRNYPMKQGKNTSGNGTLTAIDKLPKNAKKIYMNFVISEKDYFKNKPYKVELIGKSSVILPI